MSYTLYFTTLQSVGLGSELELPSILGIRILYRLGTSGQNQVTEIRWFIVEQ